MRFQNQNKIFLLFFVFALLITAACLKSDLYAAATDTVSIKTTTVDEYVTQRDLEHEIDRVREDFIREDGRILDSLRFKVDQFMIMVGIITAILMGLFGGVTYLVNLIYSKKAKELFESARTKTDKTIESANYFYMALAETNVDRQIELYTKALLLNPNYSVTFSNRGIAYAKKGDYQLAIKDYKDAIRLDPNYATAYYHRGFANYKIGKYEDAINDLNEAIRLIPNFKEAYFYLSFVYCKRGKEGDIQLALTHLHTAAEKGFTGYEYAKTDPDLAPLRELPKYNETIELIRKNQEARSKA